MGPGDGMRDLGQRRKGFAGVFEPVFRHHHRVRPAAPLPHQPRARPQGRIRRDDDAPLTFSSLVNAASLRWVALLKPP